MSTNHQTPFKRTFKLTDEIFIEFCKGAKIAFEFDGQIIEILPPYYSPPSEEYNKGFECGKKFQRETEEFLKLANIKDTPPQGYSR